MRNVIAGTAGHIDHGKTALVRALTGIETDRLAEEKRRGISIDLGFAHLDLEDLRIGFVDVPGHERFVKNMLAGAQGIDLVLFVVAADESIKPQTREHFDICRLLGVEAGIVVLTKCDLVDADLLGLVRLEVEEFVRGSFLDGAPVVAASSATGEGLGELRRELARVARAVREKDASRHFRLPVDRAFSVHGFGTVATGTLVSGAVELEQEIELHPAGKRLRVRGLEVHGEKVPRAVAGQRTALNLAGAEAADLPRGTTLAAAGLLRSSRRLDCRFQLLPSARLLKQRAPVHFHLGTAEIQAEARLLDGRAALASGGETWVRFLLREPVLALPGDRFIVRMFSPVVTIGGGVVLDIDGPRRFPPGQVEARFRALDGASPADRLSLVVAEAPFGAGFDELIGRTGLTLMEIERVARDPRLVWIRAPQPWLCDRRWFAAVIERLKAALGEFHRHNPLAPGMPKEELRGHELAGAPAFLLDAMLAATREIAGQGEILRLAAHRLALKEDESEALTRIEALFREAGLAVPSLAEALAKSGLEAARARAVLEILLRDKKLVRIGADLVFHAQAIAGLRTLVAAHKGERFSVGTFKDWTGISRKYAIPLLEFLDRERVTRRDGGARLAL
ncbi:MAG: selenocysteine-specific translation elongation factor [Acidobacteria bacterium]|nr:selenocysteine-specific translation elongation factor [Acidobacteriota bacterium]